MKPHTWEWRTGLYCTACFVWVHPECRRTHCDKAVHAHTAWGKCLYGPGVYVGNLAHWCTE